MLHEAAALEAAALEAAANEAAVHEAAALKADVDQRWCTWKRRWMRRSRYGRGGRARSRRRRALEAINVERLIMLTNHNHLLQVAG